MSAQSADPYGTGEQSLPEWAVTAPRPTGWEAEDLDRLPEAPRHTELMDGALIFPMSPQRSWHSYVLDGLVLSLRQAVKGTTMRVEREMSIRLDRRNRPEPDLVATTAPYAKDRTMYAPEEVTLVVEAVSPDSEHRDREVKPGRYARAGIPHMWRIEDKPDGTTVYTYKLDVVTQAYVATGVHRGQLKVAEPFQVSIDLDDLTP
ncbi:Uma2 family endonuclease [Kitasatospora sp. NPDC004240]